MKKTFSLAATKSIAQQSNPEVSALIIKAAIAISKDAPVVDFSHVDLAKGWIRDHFRAGGEIATFQLPPAWVAAGHKL